MIFHIALLCLLVSVLTSCDAFPALENPRTFSSRLYEEDAVATLSFKQPKLCDPTVVQYSGYIDVDTDEHYFFWFFESRHNPDTAGLTMWLNGGPGCTSMTGLWEEVGPCKVNTEGTKDLYNELGSWNGVTNMLFLDQPANTGFSYGDRLVNSTDKAKLRAYQFLQLFLEAFPKYQKQPFHLFGYILEKNQSPSLPANKRINLESIGIGNGITDVLVQVKLTLAPVTFLGSQYAETMACHSSYGSVLLPSDCEEIRNNTPKCVHLMETCEKTGTVQDCDNATVYCAKYVENIYLRSGRDIYDIRASQDQKSGTEFPKFLNTPHVLKQIGARTKFRHCSTNVYGVHGWTEVFDFKASGDYRGKELKPWLVDGVEAGQIQYGGNLTFIRVYQAGHKVPYYQPKACRQMFINHLNHIPM
ncbi:hypothetical protein [Absidia glauca]|uniref:Carboxypeptidase n=1 Tax=Absidia glauca TaxID=4829 RepID=A0A163TIX8_ABSGL|nr:hypothetical protein [Absidia glauca]